MVALVGTIKEEFGYPYLFLSTTKGHFDYAPVFIIISDITQYELDFWRSDALYKFMKSRIQYFEGPWIISLAIFNNIPNFWRQVVKSGYFIFAHCGSVRRLDPRGYSK